MNKKYLLIAGFLILFSIANVSACYFSFTLTDSNNNEQSIRPFTPVTVYTEDTYRLTIIFTQDHNNCAVPADETDLLLYEEKWKTTKDYLPMQLLSTTAWEQTGTGAYTLELNFTPKIEGTWDLQILRECSKGGYDESLVFDIQKKV